jgi:hypothetical protein
LERQPSRCGLAQTQTEYEMAVEVSSFAFFLGCCFGTDHLAGRQIRPIAAGVFKRRAK